MTFRARITRPARLCALLAAACAGCSSDGDTWSSKSTPLPTTAPAANGQWTYNTPEAAVEAMIEAARHEDRETLRAIFGPDLQMLQSGDDQQDRIDLQQFTASYDLKHSLAKNDSNTRTLIMGVQDWIFPAPLVRENKRWRFDTAAGVDEIIVRTVGMNEIHVIYSACPAFVRAEDEYFEMDPDGDGVKSYAARLRSTSGTRDGLYWPDAPGVPQSPLGDFVDQAVAAGTLEGGSVEAHKPYRGYHYRIITSQGPGAPGGAMNYIDDTGKMTRGYALVAWPADYGQSGVMTFIVSKDGIVYQSDLGEDTATMVEKITTYDPAGWDLAAN